MYPYVITSLYKGTSFVLYIALHFTLGGKPLASVSSHSQLGIDALLPPPEGKQTL
jgi:hypothetical protein